MADISFAQVVWVQDKKTEIEQIKERFKRIISTCMSNTVFQMMISVL